MIQNCHLAEAGGVFSWRDAFPDVADLGDGVIDVDTCFCFGSGSGSGEAAGEGVGCFTGSGVGPGIETGLQGSGVECGDGI